MDDYKLKMGSLTVMVATSNPFKVRGTPDTWETAYTAVTYVGKTQVQVSDRLKTKGFPTDQEIEKDLRNNLQVALRDLHTCNLKARGKPSKLE